MECLPQGREAEKPVDRPRVLVLATLWMIALAVAATAPALFGDRSLGPEFLLDGDPFYTDGVVPKAPPIFDPTRYYYDLPRDYAAADGLHHGRIDLWNPRIGLGRPLWSEGGALLFPAKIPFYLSPSRRSYDVATALRLVIAGVGAFLLARRRGLAPLPALAAGSLFELSGAILSTLQLGVMTPSCLLPWLLLGAAAIAQHRRLVAAGATALAIAITASSGHPMLVVVVFVGFGAAVIGHVLSRWRQPLVALHVGVLAALATVLGLAIAAPAVLPVLEAQDVGRLYKETKIYRTQLGWYRVQIRAALPISLFAPAMLQPLREPLSIAFPYTLFTPAVGLFGLVFALAGILRRGLNLPLVMVLLIGIGLTLNPPGIGVVSHLPFLQYVYPTYAWVLVTLPLSQAAGHGISLLAARRGRVAILVGLVLTLVGASSLVYVRDAFPGSFLEFPVRRTFLALLAERSGWLILLGPIVAVAASVVVLAIGAGSRFAHRCMIAATGFAAIELMLSLAPVTWFPDSRVLGAAPSSAVRFLQQRLGGDEYRMLGFPRTVANPATSSFYGIADVRGASALPVERYVRYLEAIEAKPGWYVWQFLRNAVRHPLLDLAALRYVVRQRFTPAEPEPLLQGDAAVPLVYSDRWVEIYQNEAALPRARIVHTGVSVRDREEAFQRLVAEAAAGPHARDGRLIDHVFVEPSSDGQLPPATAPQVTTGSAASDTAEIIPGEDPDRVDIQAHLSRPGWVVLADTFYPGWQATIDGVPTPIHPANLAFRAVFAPAGSHRIVFHYQPDALRIGVPVSLVALLLTVALIARGTWPEVRARRHAARIYGGG